MAEYIRRDEVIEKITDIFTAAPKELMYIAGRCIGAIDAIPTADVAPVVHGEWIDEGDGDWRCSRCKSIFTMNEDMHPIYDNGLYRCPNCGAKMEAERKDS